MAKSLLEKESVRKKETKQRNHVWLYPSTIDHVDRLLAYDNCKSQSEFIEKAVQFYVGYISEKDSSRFLSRTLISTLRGMLSDTENRMASLLFKLTVEMSMMMHVLSSMTSVDDNGLNRLRARCVEDAKRTNGAISFAQVMRYQHRRE